MSYRPPDARAESNFEILKGLGSTAFLLDMPISDANVAITFQADDVSVGDFLRNCPNTNNTNAFVLSDVAVGIVGTRYGAANTHEDGPLGVAWDAYDNDNVNGHPDANARDRLTVLHGEFIAKIPQSKFISPTQAQTVTLEAGVFLLGEYGRIEAGRKVIMINWATAGAFVGDMLCTIPIDYAEIYAGANPTPAEAAMMNSVIGQIVKVPDSSFVHVRFSF